MPYYIFIIPATLYILALRTPIPSNPLVYGFSHSPYSPYLTYLTYLTYSPARALRITHCIAHYALCIAHCIVHSAFLIAHYALCIAHSSLRITHCALRIVLRITHCALHIVLRIETSQLPNFAKKYLERLISLFEHSSTIGDKYCH